MKTKKTTTPKPAPPPEPVLASGIPVHCAFNELVDVVKLVRHPKNSNTHPDAQIALLVRVIRAQGWRSPIVVSRRSGFMVAGHGRALAAGLLQVELVPVNFQNFKDEAEELAHLMADNRLAELSETDDALLADAFAALTAAGGDIDLTGFSTEDLNIDPGDDADEANQGEGKGGDDSKGGASLVLGKTKITMTPEEAAGLAATVNAYTAEHGSPDGFVAWLLGRIKSAANHS